MGKRIKRETGKRQEEAEQWPQISGMNGEASVITIWTFVDIS